MPTKKEEFRVSGSELLKKVKALIKEGNVRRITIKDKKGNIILNIPLTIGFIGVVVAAPLAAVSVIAALIAECTITVERD